MVSTKIAFFYSINNMEDYVMNDRDSDSDIDLDITKYKETRDKLHKLSERHSRITMKLSFEDNILFYLSNGENKKETNKCEEVPSIDYDRLNNMDYDLYDGSKHEISKFTFLTRPSKHYVRNTEDGKIYLMDAISICRIFMDEGVNISETPFSEWEEVINNQNEMSDEIKEKVEIFKYARERMKKIKSKIKTLDKNNEENAKKYTSNNRLERLKKKHNISP